MGIVCVVPEAGPDVHERSGASTEWQGAHQDASPPPGHLETVDPCAALPVEWQPCIHAPGLFLSSLFFGNILLGASNHLRVAPCPILVI